ncbi:MAG: squalene/phytoene synthase family protein [Candidatus Micrarchaeia archaeon]|jgi:farnesyl-diphosphate farnesyltransferase
MNDRETCWELLPKVSRSFALCIKVLPEPLNEQMMLSYMVFRVIDTIEDSHASLRTKKSLFKKVLSLLSRRHADDNAAKELSRALLAKLDYTYEKELLEQLPALNRHLFSQPLAARRAIVHRGSIMAKGMCKFQKKPIETFADQDRYSYYAAGVVGHLFNDLLFINGIISLHLRRQLSRYARQFGLALQKVNILRDIADDIAANRYYWPKQLLAKYGLEYSNICSAENREKALSVLREQIADARKYINSAMQYILKLPKEALRVRMFCLIPLFMAIESFVKCMDNAEVFEAGKKVKISREQVGDIVAKSSLWGANNERLVKWFLSTMGSSAPAISDFAVYKSR